MRRKARFGGGKMGGASSLLRELLQNAQAKRKLSKLLFPPLLSGIKCSIVALSEDVGPDVKLKFIFVPHQQQLLPYKYRNAERTFAGLRGPFL